MADRDGWWERESMETILSADLDNNDADTGYNQVVLIA